MKEMLKAEVQRTLKAMGKLDPASPEYAALADTATALQQRYNELIREEAKATNDADKNVVEDRKVDAEAKAAQDKVESELEIARIKAESEQKVEASRAETEKIKADVEQKKTLVGAYVELGRIVVDGACKVVGVVAGCACVGGILKAEEVGAVTSKALSMVTKWIFK